jgi:hypothetical protein
MKEDHATICILISWIGQSKEKQNAKENSLTDWRTEDEVSKDMEL